MDYDEKVALMDKISRLENKLDFLSRFLFRITYSLAPMSVAKAEEEYNNT